MAATQRTRTRRALGWILDHPWVDFALAVAAPVLLYVGGAVPHLPGDARLAFVGGASTIAGLVMTGATFICALTYQSSNILMAKVRDLYSRPLRRNWASILGGAFISAVAPVASLLLTGYPWVASLACVSSLVLISCVFTRAIFWMRYTLFMQSAADERPVVAAPAITLPDRDHASV